MSGLYYEHRHVVAARTQPINVDGEISFKWRIYNVSVCWQRGVNFVVCCRRLAEGQMAVALRNCGDGIRTSGGNSGIKRLVQTARAAAKRCMTTPKMSIKSECQLSASSARSYFCCLRQEYLSQDTESLHGTSSEEQDQDPANCNTENTTICHLYKHIPVLLRSCLLQRGISVRSRTTKIEGGVLRQKERDRLLIHLRAQHWHQTEFLSLQPPRAARRSQWRRHRQKKTSTNPKMQLHRP